MRGGGDGECWDVVRVLGDGQGLQGSLRRMGVKCNRQ